MIVFFASPRTVEAAVKLKQEHPEAIYAAGTTDIAVELYHETLKANGLIDLSRIAELDGFDPQRHIVGALTTFSQLLRADGESPELLLLKKMAQNVAAVQVRNRGTIGGNIANANPAADSLPVLSVLNTSALVTTPEGAQTMPLEKFLRLRGQGDTSTLLTALRYEPLPEGAGTAFIKIGRRTSLAIARINACASLSGQDGVITDARLSLGAVSKVTGRFANTERYLKGAPLCEDTFVQAGVVARREAGSFIGGRASAQYKLSVIEDLVPELFRQCRRNMEGLK